MKKIIKVLLFLFFTVILSGCMIEYENTIPPNSYNYLRSPFYYYYGYPYYGYPYHYRYNPYYYHYNPRPNIHYGPRRK